jgi:hypothetical protein
LVLRPRQRSAMPAQNLSRRHSAAAGAPARRRMHSHFGKSALHARHLLALRLARLERCFKLPFFLFYHHTIIALKLYSLYRRTKPFNQSSNVFFIIIMNDILFLLFFHNINIQKMLFYLNS